MTQHRHWLAIGAACWIAACAATGNAPARNDGAPVAASRVGCAQQTGSRFSGEGCIGPAHSYSQNDIANTGQTTVAGALGLLDPTVTVHH
jgi:hypothetical protein